MQQSWADLRLRADSAATAILAETPTMPAVGIPYLQRRTERPARSLRRALRKLVNTAAVAESRDEDTGQTVFELPQMLQIFDQRSSLLQDCWHLHDAGIESAAPTRLERFRKHNPQRQPRSNSPPGGARQRQGPAEFGGLFRAAR